MEQVDLSSWMTPPFTIIAAVTTGEGEFLQVVEPRENCKSLSTSVSRPAPAPGVFGVGIETTFLGHLAMNLKQMELIVAQLCHSIISFCGHNVKFYGSYFISYIKLHLLTWISIMLVMEALEISGSYYIRTIFSILSNLFSHFMWFS